MEHKVWLLIDFGPGVFLNDKKLEENKNKS